MPTIHKPMQQSIRFEWDALTKPALICVTVILPIPLGFFPFRT